MGELETGVLPTSKAFHETLHLLRALREHLPAQAEEFQPTGREVGVAFIESTEAAIGATLPNDIWATAVLRIPALLRATGLSVAKIANVVRDCAGSFGAPRGWIAVASFGEHSMQDDAPPAFWGVDSLLCVAEGTHDRTTDVAVRTRDSTETTSPEMLSAFLERRLSRRYSTHGIHWLEALAAAQADTRPIADDFLVRVVDDRPPPPGPKVMVRHPKFGLGTIERTVEGDKVEVMFPEVGTKTVLRSFLKDP